MDAEPIAPPAMETPAEPPSPMPEAPQPGRKRWSRLRVALGITGLLLLVVGAALFLLTRPSPSEPFYEATEANTRGYDMLAAGGLQDAVVDITAERALARYNEPEGVDPEATWIFVMQTLATVAPDTPIAVVQRYADFSPVEEIIAEVADVLAYLEGDITVEEFAERVERRALS